MKVASESDVSLKSGTRLGPYEIVSFLGAGGMGEVYRARDTRLRREVAIKVLPEGLASDRERLKRFEKEGRAASGLNHPNVVTIHEIASSDSRTYITMELVEGDSLRKRLSRGALPIKKILQVAPQIAEGLARAHEAGLVHRDLKPENVMVGHDGIVKILDFGLAKRRVKPAGQDDRTETATDAGAVIGTAGYMSPEQVSGSEIDHRSDQFSLGAILYEMATGRRAFHKKTSVETMSAILNEEPLSIAEVSRCVPAPLRWIVERCLAKSPDDRYASTRDLARDLVLARDRLSEAGPPGFPAGAPRRVRAIALAALAFMLAAVGTGWFFGDRRARRDGP